VSIRKKGVAFSG